MEGFPIVTNSQVVVLKADAYTGQVLTVNNEVYIGDNKPAYMVFETIDLAYKYIKEMGPVYTRVEFCIFDKEDKLIEYIPATGWAGEKISYPLRMVPVICLPLRRKYLHTMPDFAYGEWLIFEDNIPKYYLNIFDESYKDIRRFLEVRRDINVELMIKKSLGNVDQRLSLRQNYRVITMLESQSELITFELEKVSPGFLISGVVSDFRKFMDNGPNQE